MDKHTLDTFKRLAEAMKELLGDRAEAVLHDFSDIRHSLVHVAGNLTRRKPGAPITDMAFKLINQYGDQAPDKLGYKNITNDGRVLKCSTVFIRDENGGIVGSFGVNYDITDFINLSNMFGDFASFSSQTGNSGVRYAHNIRETMESVLDRAVAEFGKPAAAMSREDRKQIVAELEKGGVFMIKGAVQYLAKLLGASRYTIYSYIKEVRGE